MEEKNWYYEKLDEEHKIKRAPINDYDGSVTGKIVIGVSEWFDENPEEARRLGWTKHITHDTKLIGYNKQTQYLLKSMVRVDEYTIEDIYHIVDKPEEMMVLEEMSGSEFYGFGGITIVGADF